MKKLMILLLLCSTTVHADDWILPLFGGVALGTIIGSARYEQPYYIVESRQYYTPPAPVYYPPNYGGSPYGYHYGSIYDGYCGCYKTVLLPN